MSSNPYYNPALMAAAKAYHHRSMQSDTPAHRGMLTGQAIENYNKHNAWNTDHPYAHGMTTYYNAVANQARKQSPTRKPSPSPDKKGGRGSHRRVSHRRVSHRRIRRTRRHH